MFRIAVGRHSLLVHRGPLPGLYGEYRKQAVLAEEFGDLGSAEGEACFVAVGTADEWPVLVVAQRFEPCVPGFDPGVLLVPETGVLFLGAGERLLAYDLDRPRRLWEDTAEVGFWGWDRFGETVLMLAELELAAWDTSGRKLWTSFVEPPWSYRVRDDRIHLDVMGRLSEFGLVTGPAA